jgi:hypothetical protein
MLLDRQGFIATLTPVEKSLSPKVQMPEQELRFTRSGQAVGFWLAAAMLAMAALTLMATSFHRPENPALPHPVWALAPLSGSLILARMAWKLTRHAYLILTPLGIEIFPFFRPADGMSLVSWHEVDSAETNPSLTRMTLHHNPEKTSGIHLSLRPIRPDRRSLLVSAVARRLRQNHAS